MPTPQIGVGLAKPVFQVATSTASGQVRGRRRLIPGKRLGYRTPEGRYEATPRLLPVAVEFTRAT